MSDHEQTNGHWLERNLIHLSVPSGVDMSGNRVAGQLHNEARGSGGGPSYVRVWSPDIRGDELEEMNFSQRNRDS